MRFADAFRMAGGGLSERKTRTILTVLGIVIGSSMIVALFASTQGQSDAIQDQLGKLGPTTLIVRGQGTTRFGAADLETVLTVEGVQTAFLTVSGSGQVTRAGITGPSAVVGIAAADLPILVPGLRIAEGEVFAEGDMTAAFVGVGVASPDAPNGTFVYTGDPITLTAAPSEAHGATPTRRSFTISGVASEFGSAPFLDVDNTVFVAPRTAQQLLRMNTAQYNQIIVIAQSADDVPVLQTAIRDALGRGIVLSGTQLADTIGGVYESIGRLLASIAAISLLVAGVGIANTMFVSVLERTTEIGTLKALGFKARSIMGVFLLEASLTGLIGGILGSILGIGISFGIGSFINIGSARAGGGGTGGAAATLGGAEHGPGGGGGGFGGEGFARGGAGAGVPSGISVDADPVFTPQLFLIAIAFAVLIALVAGLIPARKAASLDPVVALKRL